MTAEPNVAVVELGKDDTWAVVCSDGLFANEERGGGGGLTNQEIMDICNKSPNVSPDELAMKLCREAQNKGSTDDVTCICVKLT